MISREKLIKSLGNSKFKSIQLPNNGNYLQKSYLDNKKLEFDSILKKLNLLKENSNILNVIPQIKNQLESHYQESIIQENKTSTNNRKINYDNYLNYSENDKVNLPDLLNKIFYDKTLNHNYLNDKIFLYGVKNPESFYKSVIILTNIEFIVKNKYESNQDLLTYKNMIAYTLENHYYKKNFKLFPEKFFSPQKAIKNILNKENYTDIGIIQYTCMHLEKNLLIFNLSQKSFSYYSYHLNNSNIDNSNIDNNNNHNCQDNETYIIINNNGVYLPCMNVNKKNLFSNELIQLFRSKFTYENPEMYVKFDSSKEIVDVRLSNSIMNNKYKQNNIINNTNKLNNTNVKINNAGVTINNIDSTNKINSINNINSNDNIINNQNFMDELNNPNNRKAKKVISKKKDIKNKKDNKKEIKKNNKESSTSTKTPNINMTDSDVNSNNSNNSNNSKIIVNNKTKYNANKKTKKKTEKVFILDNIKSYTLLELQNMANEKNINIMKQGKTKEIKKTKQELYNELNQ